MVIRMLENVRQVTIRPLIERFIAPGNPGVYRLRHLPPLAGVGFSTIGRLVPANTPCDDDGDGFCEVHVNTAEGFWSLLRSWLRPSDTSKTRFLGRLNATT